MRIFFTVKGSDSRRSAGAFKSSHVKTPAKLIAKLRTTGRLRLSQTEERQDRQNNHHEADQVNDAVHVFLHVLIETNCDCLPEVMLAKEQSSGVN